MLIVGELINSSRKAIKEAVEAKDAAYIQQIAKEQAEAGADYIDVNCGTQFGKEVETMEWLVETICEVIKDKPLCIDSPDAAALDAGLALVKKLQPDFQPMINSINFEQERYKEVLPLVTKYDAKIVALLMDDTGIPDSAEKRLAVADNLYKGLTEAGVADENIYFDPLIQPISVNAEFGVQVLDTVAGLTAKYPKCHKMCGLSNISFGLPNRKILNSFFVAQTMVVGMDGFIVNPTDKLMMGTIAAGTALIGQDDYCMGYLTASRKGLYD
ncbi:MAG TPA: methyltetrahydrofolate cobalamin methyltransferase [Clostridiales bacterium]|jgi:5-methyltetrahydrofolate--homocysteine methyltransferase|nr:methyltetrahydrofolate cobalamin methyltransferase [Clostridiales bacterium]